jgi:hypothetical protein
MQTPVATGRSRGDGKPGVKLITYHNFVNHVPFRDAGVGIFGLGPDFPLSSFFLSPEGQGSLKEDAGRVAEGGFE